MSYLSIGRLGNLAESLDTEGKEVNTELRHSAGRSVTDQPRNPRLFRSQLASGSVHPVVNLTVAKQ